MARKRFVQRVESSSSFGLPPKSRREQEITLEFFRPVALHTLGRSLSFYLSMLRCGDLAEGRTSSYAVQSTRRSELRFDSS